MTTEKCGHRYTRYEMVLPSSLPMNATNVSVVYRSVANKFCPDCGTQIRQVRDTD